MKRYTRLLNAVLMIVFASVLGWGILVTLTNLSMLGTLFIILTGNLYASFMLYKYRKFLIDK